MSAPLGEASEAEAAMTAGIVRRLLTRNKSPGVVAEVLPLSARRINTQAKA
jgi:hypothetical protein